jgi:nitrate reductase assembly molybdenum cofactor insertion protein NarJ
VLVPAGKLLNGTTIARAECFDTVQYFHIELPRHAVLYAEGAAAESYRDTGNRNMFANVLEYRQLGYDLDAPPLPACLPIVTEGAALEAVRAAVAGRARAVDVVGDLHAPRDCARMRLVA